MHCTLATPMHEHRYAAAAQWQWHTVRRKHDTGWTGQGHQDSRTELGDSRTESEKTVGQSSQRGEQQATEQIREEDGMTDRVREEDSKTEESEKTAGKTQRKDQKVRETRRSQRREKPEKSQRRGQQDRIRGGQ